MKRKPRRRSSTISRDDVVHAALARLLAVGSPDRAERAVLRAAAHGLHRAPHVAVLRQQVPPRRHERVAVDAAAFVDAAAACRARSPRATAARRDRRRRGRPRAPRRARGTSSGIERGVDPAEDDVRAALARRGGRPRSRAARCRCGCRCRRRRPAASSSGSNGSSVSSTMTGVPYACRRRGRQHEQPARRDDRRAEREVAGVDEMYAHEGSNQHVGPGPRGPGPGKRDDSGRPAIPGPAGCFSVSAGLAAAPRDGQNRPAILRPKRLKNPAVAVAACCVPWPTDVPASAAASAARCDPRATEMPASAAAPHGVAVGVSRAPSFNAIAPAGERAVPGDSGTGSAGGVQDVRSERESVVTGGVTPADTGRDSCARGTRAAAGVVVGRALAAGEGAAGRSACRSSVSGGDTSRGPLEESVMFATGSTGDDCGPPSR